jgi:DNA polymerase-3 subunit delta
MLYLLWGPDSFSARERVKELAQSFAGIRVLTEEAELATLSSLQSTTLFGEEYLIVVRDLLKKTSVQQIQNVSTTLVIWEADSLDRRQAVVKWLLEQASVEEFPNKPRQEVYSWARQQGYTLDYDLLQILWDRHGSNLWAWSNELEKLSLLNNGEKTISSSSGVVLAAPTLEENIFDFLDLVGNRKPLPSFKALEQLLGAEVDPFFLHTMLARQIRLLLLSQEPSGLSGNPPFVVRKIQAQGKLWSTSELLHYHQQLLRIDELVKTGRADMSDELITHVLQE